MPAHMAQLQLPVNSSTSFSWTWQTISKLLIHFSRALDWLGVIRKTSANIEVSKICYMDVLILVIIKCCATKFLVTRTLYKFQNCPFNALSYIFVPGSHERTILNVMFSNINTQSHFFRTLPSLVHPPVRCFSCPYTTITNRKEQQSFASRYVCILPTVLRCYSYFTRFGGGWWSTRLPTAPCGRLVHCSP